jgi:hypothetical protein
MIDLKLSIGVEVRGNDAQEEVAVAGHEMALDDLRQLLHAFGEAIHRSRVLSRQPDAGEHRQAHADFRRVQKSDVAIDHAGLFEQPDARRRVC